MVRRVVMACDHTARPLKETLAQLCRDKGWQVEDIGTHSDASCDYPLIAVEAARRVVQLRDMVSGEQREVAWDQLAHQVQR